MILFFNKYNKLLGYAKLLELINISLDNNIVLNDIHLSPDNFTKYNPQIIFSVRRSIEQLYKKKLVNNSNSIEELNNYIDFIPKMNDNSISDNNTTIINNNTLYSFSNNNIENKCNNIYLENKNNKFDIEHIEDNNNIYNKNINSNKNQIKNEEMNIIFKANKNNSTMIEEINRNNKILDIKMFKSMNLEELMKRIKSKNKFYCCDYKEEDLKCKYLSIKLLNKFIFNKRVGLKFLIFKKIKALYYVNNKNKIDNQINIFIFNENEKEK